MIVEARRSVVRRVAALLIAVMAAAGCAQDDPVVEESPSASVTEEATASPSASATAASSPSATADPQKLTSPEESAKHLFEAWKAGDKAKALKFAEQGAVDDVFSRPYTGPDPEFMGCDHEVDHYFCRFRYEGGSTTYRVDGGVSAGYRVTEVTQTAD